MNIPDDAVEAAERDPVLRHLNAHYRPAAAADLLAAAQPLMAIAWDEGYRAGEIDGAYQLNGHEEPDQRNPYRKDAP